ncbi:flavin reductase family protein [Mycolicibacterium mengxianglii]|uniref:flavin reductase family protein n=1 Tax=Mycolicibacterium mengxianglii TaxID=2736649 RepID=UPI0018D0C229|nr:flavin reductase family protein [Mycolicibacterium mengxianglii]
MTSLGTDSITPEALRKALALFPSGVTAVCALVDGQPVGMAASSFTSVSLEPPLVSICVAHTSTTWPRLRTSHRIGISVLARTHDVVARQLSAKGVERFLDVPWLADPNGGVFLYDSALWLECSIEQEVTAGDHAVVLLKVLRFSAYPDVAPMVFHGSKFRGIETETTPAEHV